MATVATGVGGVATQYSGQGKVHVAPDGDALVFYWDGSAWPYRTAVAPYTTWSSAAAVTGALLAGTLATCMDPATGDVHVVYKRTGGPLPTYRKFTKGAPAAGWTMGSASNVATTGDYGNDSSPTEICLDLSGRIWIKMAEWVGGFARRLFYSSNGTSWTNFANGGTVNPNAHATHICAVYTGGTQYLLSVRQSSGQLYWQRVQTSGGSVGTMGSEANISPSPALHDDHSSALVGLPDGRALLLVTPAGGNEYAPTSFLYTTSSDTWQSTGTTVGTSNNSRYPSLVVDAVAGLVYGAWSEYNAASSYSIPYKVYTPGTTTWGSATDLFAAGSNRIYPNLGTDGTSLVVALTNDTSGIVESGVATVASGPPGITGTHARSVTAVTGAASGTALLAITGTHARTLTPATSAATGTALLAISGTHARPLTPATAAAAGTVSGVVTGTAAGALAPATSAASGNWATGTFSGAAAGTLAPATGAATGSSLLAITGAAAGVLAPAAGAGSGFTPVIAPPAAALGVPLLPAGDVAELDPVPFAPAPEPALAGAATSGFAELT